MPYGFGPTTPSGGNFPGNRGYVAPLDMGKMRRQMGATGMSQGDIASTMDFYQQYPSMAASTFKQMLGMQRQIPRAAPAPAPAPAPGTPGGPEPGGPAVPPGIGIPTNPDPVLGNQNPAVDPMTGLPVPAARPPSTNPPYIDPDTGPGPAQQANKAAMIQGLIGNPRANRANMGPQSMRSRYPIMAGGMGGMGMQRAGRPRMY